MNWLQWTITSSLLNWGLCFPASPHLSGPPTKRRTCKTLANWSDATDFTLKVVLQPDEITDRWSCGLVGCCIVLVLLCSNSLLALNIKGGDGGVWWAAIYGVAQSRTQLKWLSSSSMLLYSSMLVFWASPFNKLSYATTKVIFLWWITKFL